MCDVDEFFFLLFFVIMYIFIYTVYFLLAISSSFIDNKMRITLYIVLHRYWMTDKTDIEVSRRMAGAKNEYNNPSIDGLMKMDIYLLFYMC